jgi:hypothetical protein
VLSQSFIWVALVIATSGNLFYLRDTLKGETKPNRVSFFLWGAAPLIAFFAQHGAGAGQQIFYTLFFVVMNFIILAASFLNAKAYWRISSFDIICGVIALTALACLFLHNKLLLSLFLSIVADLFASIPTLIKAYNHPETETTLAYGAEMVSSLIILLTIHNWIFANYFFTIYILLMNILFTSLLMFSPKKKAKLKSWIQ